MTHRHRGEIAGEDIEGAAIMNENNEIRTDFLVRRADRHANRIRAIYDDLLRAGRVALSTGAVDVDPLPVDGGPRWGISAVLRPRVWPDALVRCAADLSALAGPRAVVYAPDNFHITLQQFEGHRTRVPPDDPALREQSNVLAAITLPRAAIALRGLTASRGGIIVQGWPDFDLQAWRARLHRELATTSAPVRGPETALSDLRKSAHATLALFGGAVAHADELVAYIDAHRDTDFGTFALDELWLVGYARTTTSVRLIEYGRFAADGPAGPTR